MQKDMKDVNSLYKRSSSLVTVLARVMNPSIKANVTKDGRVLLKVYQCNSVQFNQIRIFSEQREKVGKIVVGNTITEEADIGWIDLLPEKKSIPAKGYVEMDYVCGKDWEGKGFTMFAKRR